PIVATILMFVLILAAIGISLVYMMPSIILFKENSYNNTARLYFTSLDSTIQNMLNNQPPVSRDFGYYQEEGSLFFDNSWNLYFFINDIAGGASNLILYENITRLVHKTTNVEDYQKGEHRYLIGPQEQDYLFINGSSTMYNDITVLNETRRILDPYFLYLSLYYRYSLNIEYQTEGNTESYFVDIVHVELNTNEEIGKENTTKTLQLQLEYEGTTKSTLEPIIFTNDLRGEVKLYGDLKILEEDYPLYIPKNDNYSFHYLYINIIKIKISINIVK
ncbi:MAG: hypothetical protein ACTSPI_07205, partial [Candidatus Heimdallarchaeaceae archaeon]